MRSSHYIANSILMILLAVLFACNSKNEESASFNYPKTLSISGQVLNPQKADIKLFKITNEGRVGFADISTDQGGSFLKKIKLESPGLYLLSVYNLQEKLLILDGSDVRIKVDGKDPSGIFEITSSKEQEYLESFDSLKKAFQQEASQLTAALSNPDNKGKTNELVNDFRKRQEEKVKAFSLEKKGSLASLIISSSMLRVSDHLSLFEDLVEQAKLRYGDSPLIQQIEDNIELEKATAIGSKAPEIMLPNAGEKPIALSSLKGDFVLIDFWASWCTPCRQENPYLKKAYQKFKDKGFEIYGVSLDRDRDSWLNAIKDDGLPWVHVSDLKFWKSQAAKDYNVSAIPMSFLLDPEGVIIEKNLRGEALMKKLEELLD